MKIKRPKILALASASLALLVLTSLTFFDNRIRPFSGRKTKVHQQMERSGFSKYSPLKESSSTKMSLAQRAARRNELMRIIRSVYDIPIQPTILEDGGAPRDPPTCSIMGGCSLIVKSGTTVTTVVSDSAYLAFMDLKVQRVTAGGVQLTRAMISGFSETINLPYGTSLNMVDTVIHSIRSLGQNIAGIAIRN
jgi:hypothetical protein